VRERQDGVEGAGSPGEVSVEVTLITVGIGPRTRFQGSDLGVAVSPSESHEQMVVDEPVVTEGASREPRGISVAESLGRLVQISAEPLTPDPCPRRFISGRDAGRARPGRQDLVDPADNGPGEPAGCLVARLQDAIIDARLELPGVAGVTRAVQGPQDRGHVPCRGIGQAVEQRAQRGVAAVSCVVGPVARRNERKPGSDLLGAEGDHGNGGVAQDRQVCRSDGEVGCVRDEEPIAVPDVLCPGHLNADRRCIRDRNRLRIHDPGVGSRVPVQGEVELGGARPCHVDRVRSRSKIDVPGDLTAVDGQGIVGRAGPHGIGASGDDAPGIVGDEGLAGLRPDGRPRA